MQLPLLEIEAPVDRLAAYRQQILVTEIYDDSVTRAVLILNNRERAHDLPELRERLSRAQDWLCLELEEWCHTILREW